MKSFSHKLHLIGRFVLVFSILTVAGCGGRGDGEQATDVPIPNTPKEIQSTGTPIRFLGLGNPRFRPGANDPEYQEYLLWKEWQEYRKYLEFKGSSSLEAPAPENQE